MHQTPLTLKITALVSLVALAQGANTAQQPPPPAEFSPLGYYDLRAYEQAYPADPTHPAVRQAAAARYWVFQGIAYRGTQAQDEAWTSLGPEASIAGSGTSAVNVSGRVVAMAISPRCQLEGPCRMWVGTAGGGVWRTDDAMNTEDVGWRWISAGLGTNSIGALTLDPNDRTGNTIFVGTGETNSPHTSGAGTGLYKSTDGGDRWTRVSTMVVDPAISPASIDFTYTRGIGAIAIEPGNPQTMYVATTTAMLGMTAIRGGQVVSTGYPQPRVGLYKTENGGITWTLLWTPPLEPVVPANPHLGVGVGDTMAGVRHVELDPRSPRIVYASAFNNAIHRSAPPLEGGDASFKPIYAISGFRRFRDLAMFDLAVVDGRMRIYVYNGTETLNDQALYRVDNADVPAAALVTGSGAALANTSAWIKLSSNEASHPGVTSGRICSSQCFYDLVVASPENRPDTVLVGGVATVAFGEPTIRSKNAGVSFTGFGFDAAGNSSHVDVRAIVFHPQNPDIAFVGSDGGVVRNDGRFQSATNICAESFPNSPQCQTAMAEIPARLYFLNKGLQTLQFYNIALDPRDPLRRMMGGLQDNSTIWMDGTGPERVWRSLFPFGDGTSACGFHPTRSDVLFASFQSNRFFTNFRNGQQSFWVRTDDPIRASNERATVTASTGRQFITFDPAEPDTQFTGFQHIWRTKNNGGNQAFLETSCRFPGGTSSLICGDWVPLGVTYPFVASSTPESNSRRPGDLTSDVYGSDRAGGIVVAAERPADANTLWAATSFGRLFVSKNANGPAPDVRFARIDTPATPNRFISRVVVNRGNANEAFVSYSGFNALTPSTPGHIFRVRYDPQSERATFESLDFDLGDLPINTLAYDAPNGDLYAATDFGPLRLRRGATRWEAAGAGFPEALVVDLEIVPERRILVAATHGLGIFHLRLAPM